MQEIFQVDAFSDKPFAGNPAGVCLLKEERSAEWMQRIATEMNLSETAYLLPAPDGYRLRWFTPGQEVDLCGHATLASAHILWECGLLGESEQARFHTRSGLLSARKKDGLIEMDFPAEPERECPVPPGLEESLGVSPRYVGKNRFDYLVEAESEETVRKAAPDFSKLRRISARGVILTSCGQTGEYDFVSRFFAPAAGVDEDPVTGSAHCCLGPYWGAKLGKDQLTGRQISQRGGTVFVQLRGDRVLLAGKAITVFRVEVLDW